jgi:gamma-glutamylcyclotransferase (GGCT)/AIG2-like uncharacterized protein YtfP
MMAKIAVYGTFKRGHANHGLLRNSRFLGEDRTKPIFTMYNLGAFPSIVPNGNTSIHVEVYEVDASTFGRVDMFEGYPSLHDRFKIETKYGDAWIYYMKEVLESNEVISGRW